jgi:hypothetical protein
MRTRRRGTATRSSTVSLCVEVRHLAARSVPGGADQIINDSNIGRIVNIADQLDPYLFRRLS